MSLERECVDDSHFHLSKTAGQKVLKNRGARSALTYSRSNDILLAEGQLAACPGGGSLPERQFVSREAVCCQVAAACGFGGDTRGPGRRPVGLEALPAALFRAALFEAGAGASIAIGKVGTLSRLRLLGATGLRLLRFGRLGFSSSVACSSSGTGTRANS